MTRELKFSITTSESASRRFTASRPCGERTFSVTPSLPAFVSLNMPPLLKPGATPGGVPPIEPGRPPRKLKMPVPVCSHSTLITSAPSAASQRVAQGPARTHEKSSTRIPVSGLRSIRHPLRISAPDDRDIELATRRPIGGRILRPPTSSTHAALASLVNSRPSSGKPVRGGGGELGFLKECGHLHPLPLP